MKSFEYLRPPVLTPYPNAGMEIIPIPAVLCAEKAPYTPRVLIFTDGSNEDITTIRYFRAVTRTYTNMLVYIITVNGYAGKLNYADNVCQGDTSELGTTGDEAYIRITRYCFNGECPKNYLMYQAPNSWNKAAISSSNYGSSCKVPHGIIRELENTKDPILSLILTPATVVVRKFSAIVKRSLAVVIRGGLADSKLYSEIDGKWELKQGIDPDAFIELAKLLDGHPNTCYVLRDVIMSATHNLISPETCPYLNTVTKVFGSQDDKDWLVSYMGNYMKTHLDFKIPYSFKARGRVIANPVKYCVCHSLVAMLVFLERTGIAPLVKFDYQYMQLVLMPSDANRTAFVCNALVPTRVIKT